MYVARPALIRPLILPFLVISCNSVLLTSTAHAQLGVLSEGDTETAWRDAQVSALKEQLQDRSVQGISRSEIEARLKWLKSWKIGELNERPLWDSKPPQDRYIEPELDPEKTASSLRERLLGRQARPTEKDTKALEKLLSAKPGDVGVRQLHLHWLDQIQYRKTYPDEIADAALRLIGLLEQMKPTNEIQLAIAFCLYRRGRALAYRELPDVVERKAIPHPEKHSAELLGCYNQLTTMVGKGRPEFILLDIRMLRRDGWYGQALGLLEGYGELIDEKWFLKKRRDLLEELGWEYPFEEAAELYAVQYESEQ